VSRRISGSAKLAEVRTRLQTHRLDLALFEPRDAEELHEILGDPASNTIGDGAFSSLQQTEAWIERRRATHERTGLAWYAVRLRSSGELLGHAGALIGRTGEVEPEIGYLVRADRRRRGYAAEAAAAVLDEMLLERARVWATIRPWNAASLRIVEGLGFVLDRTESDTKGALQFLVRDR
jgi:RimJ/RimL family protein N-acetyltransferase